MKKIQAVIMINLLLFGFLIAEIEANDQQTYINHSNQKQLRYVTVGNSKLPPKHKNNTVEWFYNSIKQSKSSFSEQEVIDVIKKAMRSWSEVSGIIFVYKGKTVNSLHNMTDGVISIGYWSENAFIFEHGEVASDAQIVGTDTEITDGYIILNGGDQNITTVPGNLIELQGLMTHQIGHLLAIDHSDVEESIMYASPYHSYEYQTILRADDIKAAALLYPPNDSCNSTTTVSSNLDINIQSATFQTTDGTSQIWATLEYKGKDSEGNFIWKLKNSGNC